MLKNNPRYKATLAEIVLFEKLRKAMELGITGTLMVYLVGDGVI